MYPRGIFARRGRGPRRGHVVGGGSSSDIKLVLCFNRSYRVRIEASTYKIAKLLCIALIPVRPVNRGSGIGPRHPRLLNVVVRIASWLAGCSDGAFGDSGGKVDADRRRADGFVEIG